MIKKVEYRYIQRAIHYSCISQSVKYIAGNGFVTVFLLPGTYP